VLKQKHKHSLNLSVSLHLLKRNGSKFPSAAFVALTLPSYSCSNFIRFGWKLQNIAIHYTHANHALDFILFCTV